MGSDRARISYDPQQQYRGVIAQQGRVTLEADWNEAQQINSEELREETLDFVGASGTPDDGYKVVKSAQAFDFETLEGTMYVGGSRIFSLESIQYGDQADWLDRLSDPAWVDPQDFVGAPTLPAYEIVYLLLREQEVSAVEDSALLEKALGGPDTTQRRRFIQRIVRLATNHNTCNAALNDITDYWQKQGLNLKPSTLQLVPDSTLQVSFSSPTTPADLCEPEARNGYLGADNQLIRVQVSSFGGDQGQLIWGYDNAAFLYRADIVDNQTLRLKSRPVDAFHTPRLNQTVEVLRSAAQLENKEYIASATGLVRTLTAPYDPDTQKVALNAALPAEYLDSNETPQLFIRVWEETVDNFSLGNPVSLGETGLQVTFPSGTHQLHIGDYWQIAVRPGEPTEVYPRRYLDAPQPPDGPRMWVCPLAVIGWDNDGRTLNLIEDCRHPFDSLVELTKREHGEGCCTVTIRPEDVEQDEALQELLDKLKESQAQNDHVTVCFKPGIYKLSEPLSLDEKHSNLALIGCYGEVVFRANSEKKGDFLNGMIILDRADNITLKNLKFELPTDSFDNENVNDAKSLQDLIKMLKWGLKTVSGISGKSRLQLERQIKNLRISMGVRPLQCNSLTVENCVFEFELSEGINAFGVGIFSSSECLKLKIHNCSFLSNKDNLSGQLLILIGYLLTPTVNDYQENTDIQDELEPQDLFLSLLQDASFENNLFEGLTFAILISASNGAISMQNNIVRSCLNGIWILPLNSLYIIRNHDELLDESNSVVRISISKAVLSIIAASDFVSYITLLLTQSYPFPLDFKPGEAILFKENAPSRKQLQFSLDFSHNSIDTLLPSGNYSITTLFVWDVEKQLKSPKNMMVMSSNRLCNKNPTGIPTVIVVQVDLCTVTGNIIINEASTSASNDSLVSIILFPSPLIEGDTEQLPTVSAVSIMSNIFRGRSYLPSRANVPSPLNTWVPTLNTQIL